MMNFDPTDGHWVFYRDRKEWSDVKPVPQDEVERGVIRIAYSDKFVDVHDYLRAVLISEEKSERALVLTKDAILLNAANYTTWHYRRVLLEALDDDLVKELRFVAQIIEENPKNYQVWYHRQWIVEKLNNPEEELEFTESILEEESKNYHAWEHRQWAVRRFSLWDTELSFTDRLIDEDFRNNSAWNHRFFIIKNTTGFTQDVIERETSFVQKVIHIAPHNESSWNYLRGIYLNESLVTHTHLREFCEELAGETTGSTSPHLLGFTLNIYEAIMDRNSSLAEVGNIPEGETTSFLLPVSVEICERLAKEVDRIRVNYWKYIQRRLLNKFGTPLDSGDAASTD